MSSWPFAALYIRDVGIIQNLEHRSLNKVQKEGLGGDHDSFWINIGKIIHVVSYRRLEFLQLGGLILTLETGSKIIIVIKKNLEILEAKAKEVTFKVTEFVK